GNPGFSCHSTGRKGLAGAGRTNKHNTPGDLSAGVGIVLGKFEEVYDLYKVLLGLVNTGYITQTGGNLAFYNRSRPCLSCRKYASAKTARAASHTAPEKAPHEEKQTEGTYPLENEIQKDISLLGNNRIGDILRIKKLDKI